MQSLSVVQFIAHLHKLRINHEMNNLFFVSNSDSVLGWDFYLHSRLLHHSSARNDCPRTSDLWTTPPTLVHASEVELQIGGRESVSSAPDHLQHLL